MAKKIEISYEGVGTLVEASVKINGKYVCTISSNSIKTNKQTEEVVRAVEKYLTDGETLAEDLAMALAAGPMKELKKRLDEVYKKHFGKSFKAL